MLKHRFLWWCTCFVQHATFPSLKLSPLLHTKRAVASLGGGHYETTLITSHSQPCTNMAAQPGELDQQNVGSLAVVMSSHVTIYVSYQTWCGAWQPSRWWQAAWLEGIDELLTLHLHGQWWLSGSFFYPYIGNIKKYYEVQGST